MLFIVKDKQVTMINDLLTNMYVLFLIYFFKLIYLGYPPLPECRRTLSTRGYRTWRPSSNDRLEEQRGAMELSIIHTSSLLFLYYGSVHNIYEV